MKFIKIIIAFVLTIAMLYIARTNSKGQPEDYSHTENGYTFEYNSVPKGIENGSKFIPVIVKGDFSSSQKVYLRHSTLKNNRVDELDKYLGSPMAPIDESMENYTIEMQTGERGKRFYYYFEVADSTGTGLASFTNEENEPFVFKYIGDVPKIVLISHLVFIFATVFFIALAAIESFLYLTGKSDSLKPTAKNIMWSVVMCFLGGYPVGFAMNWYAFNGLWEGVPFGTDATDNKTQLLFVYIVFALLAMWGSLRDNPKKDLYSPKTLGWLGIFSFVVMLFIYLIPHSIQFSKELTYSVCYSYIAVFIIIYLAALMKNKKAA